MIQKGVDVIRMDVKSRVWVRSKSMYIFKAQLWNP